MPYNRRGKSVSKRFAGSRNYSGTTERTVRSRDGNLARAPTHSTRGLRLLQKRSLAILRHWRKPMVVNPTSDLAHVGRLERRRGCNIWQSERWGGRCLARATTVPSSPCRSWGFLGAGTGGSAAPVVCPTCWLLTNKPCARGWTNTTEKQTVIRTHTKKMFLIV